MTTKLLLGDEAVAEGALDAGIKGAFSYPGTPATEIFEHVEKAIAARPGVHAYWSGNEKVAYEEALGMSYAGGRALVSMKHVGLNVAADPFVNSALTGVGGGLVLAVADDPGMHSSQNEQDSRFYAELAQVPLFEPATPQEAYDMTRLAFEESEELGLPVVVRLVTRLCHGRAIIGERSAEETKELARRPDPNDWVLVPANARRRFRRLVELQPELLERSNGSVWNPLELAGRRGIIACGIASTYVRETLGEDRETSLLRIGRYPLPSAKIRELVDHCDEILILEEGYPFLEKRLLGLLGLPGKRIRGRLSADVPATGELTPEIVAAALGRAIPHPIASIDDLAARPPQLCRGCPHADSFRALVEAVALHDDPILFSDIGCYTLGVAPPFRAVHACVDMGASIAMAHGAASAGRHPVVCTIGDSTFGHSGLVPLLGAARRDANMTVLILDNATVAMTGTQESLTTGDRLFEVLRGLGVDGEHLRLADPLPKHHDANVALIRSEIDHRGLSVIVLRRPCIHVARPTKTEPALVAAGA